jgi:hypothetical protein
VRVVSHPLQLDQTKVYDQGFLEPVKAPEGRAHRQPARFQLLIITDTMNTEVASARSTSALSFSPMP